jgi:pimeloyl-ACP methyl ester carboxylesterase
MSHGAPAEWAQTTITVNGVSLHAVLAGGADRAGQVVVLLHGFPEFWYAWHEQIEPLARAGYRVAAIDQRGYNLSDKPRAVSEYDVNRLTGDVIGVADAIGGAASGIFLVGHDWGGHVAWATAERYPDRVRKLVVLNAAHPRVMRRNVYSNRRQTLKSWYVLVLQVPRLPEWLLGRANFAMLRRSIRGARPMSPDDEHRYVMAWSQERALTSMINWYRALFRAAPPRSDARITVPTLLIWGEKDRFLERSMAAESIGLCDNARVVYLPDATHWVHHDEPHAVRDLIGGFLSEED